MTETPEVSELERMRRRAERERTARIAAESEAEKGLRALYQTQREADLMRAIATAANEATYVGVALSTCLERVCGFVSSPVGHAWICPENTDVLSATGVWHFDNAARFAVLRGVTDAMSLRRGEGLPGRVLETGKPAWISNVSSDRSFSRNMSSQDLGVKAAFAMPALIGPTVAAVLEFFFVEEMPPDDRILALAADIGAQLGRVIERKRANAELARARDELELRVRERTTDIERVNEELRREIAERDAADAANRAKSEFLANMSHEIRTPMTAVLGYADLLMDRDITAAERLNCVQTIRRNGEHLLTVLNDILDLSKIEAGKLTIEEVSMSPAQIVVDVASLMRVRALEKGLGFTVDFATAIPETIESDPTRLRQILLNLTGNAIKFTSSGSVRLVVRCDSRRDADSMLELSVVDEGIGMAPEAVEQLFRPFMQADASTTRRYGGTGLGLVICKRLIDMLGGEIAVHSELGRGSTFTIRVPTGSLEGVPFLTDLHEAGQPAPSHVPSPHAHAARCQGRVLLAEDGHDNQVLIRTHLTREGADVSVAENGRIAVDMATEARAAGRPFDVILMDMQMPELDGYGATSKLRAQGYAAPIIALTAHAMEGDRDRCLRAGCDEYLSKPIDRPRLIATVAAFIERGRRASDERDAPLFSDYADDDAMRPIIEKFVARLSDHIALLERALADTDRTALGRLAHQLKGAGAGYGFNPITVSAAKLEMAVQADESAAELDRHVQDLVSTCRLARVAPVHTIDQASAE